MAVQVTIHEAKTHLSKLIKKALKGEEVIIANRNQPLIRLMPLPDAQPDRRIGGAEDIILHMTEDFDAPLDDFKDYME